MSVSLHVVSLESLGLECDNQEALKKEAPSPKPKFGPGPAVISIKISIQTIKFLETPLKCEQQARLIKIMYNNPEVFFLHDKDLGYCDQLSHMLLTMTD